MDLTETMHFRLPRDLKKRVQESAKREGLADSAYVRRILTLWHDPDPATLALPENRAILVDPGVEYVTGEEG
jgi:hypothetical protein